MVRSIVSAFAAFALVATAGVANGMAVPSFSAPDANTVAKLTDTMAASGHGDSTMLSEADVIQKYLMRQRRLVSEEL